MKGGLKLLVKLAAVLAAVGLAMPTAQAITYTNDDIAPSAAGAANAVVAGAEDLSAAFYNPAGLAWQQGVQAMVGSQSRYRNNNADIGGTTYEGDGNLSDRSIMAIAWLPHDSDVGMAATMSTPFATRTIWGNVFPALGSAYFLQKRYSADGFWRVNNTLGVALGVDILNSQATLDDGTLKFNGANWSQPGGHIGVRWQFQPFWLMGLHVRQGLDSTIQSDAGHKLTLALPDEITLGIAHDLADDEMRLELDIKHSRWADFNDVVISNNGVVNKIIATNFRNTTDLRLGAIWNWRHDTQLRFGYAFEQGANRLDSYQPTFADQNGHKLTAGFGGVMSGLHLDVAYTAMFTPKVDVTGTYAGQYTDRRYSFIFSVTKKF